MAKIQEEPCQEEHCFDFCESFANNPRYTKLLLEKLVLKHWHNYFNTGAVSPDAPEYIQKAGRIIDFVNLTEEERTVAKSLERAQADYDLEMYSSYMDGVAEGVAEGFAYGVAEGVAEAQIKKRMESRGGCTIVSIAWLA
ncbi:MAG: hypothetical protein FWH33_07045 [Oscillospiraceae bacterium]|nr:hypothetical protein [Oscillospiraceae bacterium]